MSHLCELRYRKNVIDNLRKFISQEGHTLLFELDNLASLSLVL